MQAELTSGDQAEAINVAFRTACCKHPAVGYCDGCATCAHKHQAKPVRPSNIPSIPIVLSVLQEDVCTQFNISPTQRTPYSTYNNW